MTETTPEERQSRTKRATGAMQLRKLPADAKPDDLGDLVTLVKDVSKAMKYAKANPEDSDFIVVDVRARFHVTVRKVDEITIK